MGTEQKHKSGQLVGLLPDEEALSTVEWLQWENVSVGQLAASERLMHSYLQCIDPEEMRVGKISLMKALDFVQRTAAFPRSAPPQKFFDHVRGKPPEATAQIIEQRRRNPRPSGRGGCQAIDQQPWRDSSRPFLSFLSRDFGFASPRPADRRYLRTLDRPLRYPNSLYVVDQFAKQIAAVRVGSPWSWGRRWVNCLQRVRQGT